jgi:hypothetical protein
MKLLFPLLSMLSLANADQTLICNKYTTALFVNNTAVNQLALITAVVNRAVLGDPAQSVPGILAPEGGLLVYFNAAENTTNQDGMAVMENFLDGAGGLPNTPPPPNSSTAMLLDHLYQFFGSVFGCTAAGFPAYMGDPDMFRVHKFMGITAEQNDYFINQVGLSAASFGVTAADVLTIYNYLDDTYNIRCAPPLKEAHGTPAYLIGTNPSICHADSCPMAMDSTCAVAMDAPMNTPMDTSRSAALNHIAEVSKNGKKKMHVRTHHLHHHLHNEHSPARQ